METYDSNIAASLVSVALYFLAVLTVAKILIGSDYKLPEKLQWINRIWEVPYIGPVIYWFYYMLTGKKKEKQNFPSK